MFEDALAEGGTTISHNAHERGNAAGLQDLVNDMTGKVKFQDVTKVDLKADRVDLLNKSFKEGGLGLSVNKTEKAISPTEILGDSKRVAALERSPELRSAFKEYETAFNMNDGLKTFHAQDNVASGAGITEKNINRIDKKYQKEFEQIIEEMDKYDFNKGSLKRMIGSKGLGHEANTEIFNKSFGEGETAFNVGKDFLKNSLFQKSQLDRKGFVQHVVQTATENPEALGEMLKEMKQGGKAATSILKDKNVQAELIDLSKEGTNQIRSAGYMSRILESKPVKYFTEHGGATLGHTLGAAGIVGDMYAVSKISKDVAEYEGASKGTQKAVQIGMPIGIAAIAGGLMSAT